MKRAARSRGGAVIACTALALASARCINDFLADPGATGSGPKAPRPRLLIVSQPADGLSGDPLAPVLVTFTDTAGTAADTAAQLTITLIGGPPGATLGGETLARVEHGEAAFTALVIDSGGTYRLAVTGPGFLPDTSDAFTVDARPQPVATVAITPGEVTIGREESIGLAAAAFDGRHQPITRPIRFTWKSNKPTIISVTADPADDAHALIRRVRDRGGATITATVEGTSGAATVH